MDNNSNNSNSNNSPSSPPVPPTSEPDNPPAAVSFSSAQNVNSQNMPPATDPVTQTAPPVNPVPPPDLNQSFQTPPTPPTSEPTPTWQPPQTQPDLNPTPSPSSDVNLNTPLSSFSSPAGAGSVQPSSDYTSAPPIDPNSFMNAPQSNPPVENNLPTPPQITTPPTPTQPDPNTQTITPPDDIIQPSWEGVNTHPTPAQKPPAEGGASQNPFYQQSSSEAPPIITEQAPTDLSHLITDTNEFISTNVPTNSQPETLVTSNGSVPETPSTATTSSSAGGKGVPKWIFGLGIGLLLAVSGASAYFILGVGQPTQNTSLPATTEEPPQQIKPPPQAITPTPTPQPQEATASGNFGDLDGASRSSTGATSAAELLRQRQQ